MSALHANTHDTAGMHSPELMHLVSSTLANVTWLLVLCFRRTTAARQQDLAELPYLLLGQSPHGSGVQAATAGFRHVHASCKNAAIRVQPPAVDQVGCGVCLAGLMSEAPYSGIAVFGIHWHPDRCAL